ncbi:MAG: hypothetical protein AAGD22_15345 [Verrucomicrobiota bacterium]
MPPQTALVLLALVTAISVAADPSITPEKTIDLLKFHPYCDITTHLNPDRSLAADPSKAFEIVENGNLLITGKGWGYARTNNQFENYHLVAEYNWGEQTRDCRTGNASVSGIFDHAQVEDLVPLETPGSRATRSSSSKAAPETSPLLRKSIIPSTPSPPRKICPPKEHNRKAPASYVDPGWTNIQAYRRKNEVEKPVGE